VALDTELNDELINEGLAREFVNRVQNMRKDAGFEVTDRIKINFLGDDGLTKAINLFKNYISNETLAEKIRQMPDKTEFNGGLKQDWKIGDFNCSIQLEKI